MKISFLGFTLSFLNLFKLFFIFIFIIINVYLIYFTYSNINIFENQNKNYMACGPLDLVTIRRFGGMVAACLVCSQRMVSF